MSKRPTLAQYPHLRQILKNDPVANQQFNQAIAGISAGITEDSASIPIRNVKRLQEQLTTNTAELAALQEMLKTQQAIITVLGETIEPQTHLRPYTQDLADAGTYEIRFTATQIREALRLHWELVARQSEAIIRGDIATDLDDENADE